jgi:hypothetical protein
LHHGVTADLRSLTEILFDDAIEQAKTLDGHFRETGQLVGPLHGVPMTLKDQFDVKGYDSTLGYVGRAFKPAGQDCVLVSLLKDMGAIILAKSNLPQSIMVCHATYSTYGNRLLKLSSGAKPIIPCGASLFIRRTPALRLVARLEERLRFYPSEALWLAGARTLEAAFEFLLT